MVSLGVGKYVLTGAEDGKAVGNNVEAVGKEDIKVGDSEGGCEGLEVHVELPVLLLLAQ